MRNFTKLYETVQSSRCNTTTSPDWADPLLLLLPSRRKADLFRSQGFRHTSGPYPAVTRRLVDIPHLTSLSPKITMLHASYAMHETGLRFSSLSVLRLSVANHGFPTLSRSNAVYSSSNLRRATPSLHRTSPTHGDALPLQSRSLRFCSLRFNSVRF